MAKKNPILAAASRTPSVVVAAFAPETEYTLTLDGWILLEALGCAYVSGGRPGMRDSILAILVMTDEDAVFEARKKGKIDQLIRGVTKDKRPADIMAQVDKIRAAFDAALDPMDDGANREKKSSAESDGGSA